MLKDLYFKPFTTKEVKPAGWLKRQLEIQASGLSGNLDKVWADVRDSKWIGGEKEGWERVPYWLDGFIPLAWLLDDENMKARATRYIDAIISRQQADGWLCPCSLDERWGYDVWALFLICKVLVVYHDCTENERIEGVIYKALYNLNNHIDRFTLKDWAAARWYECLIPLFWLYERKQEEWMIDLCHKLDAQGIDYEKVFQFWRFEQPYPHGKWSMLTHVVNMAMILKSRALFSRISGEEPSSFAKKAINTLLKDHGMAVEHFSGDECLSGTSPIQGSECCSVVEAMYSYEWLIAITGENEWADRLEKAAFNAFPAMNSPDMWTHQYDQMTNQIECSVIPTEKIHFRTNNGESHLFGLEPNYGCCTANFGQAYPKLALSALMRAKDGIAITAIVPVKLNTFIDGKNVEIEVITDYPFRDEYTVKITAPSPVEFNLYVRIPTYSAMAKIDGKPVKTGFIPIKKIWSEEQEIKIELEFEIEMKKRPSSMYCVWRGPLLYALPIKEEWQKMEYTKDGVERKFPYCDYQVLPLSKWNYAFNSDIFKPNYYPIKKVPFNPTNPPIKLKTNLIELPWNSQNGVCDEKPSSLSPIGKAEEIELIPYGCTNLRMTELPYIKIGN